MFSILKHNLECISQVAVVEGILVPLSLSIAGESKLMVMRSNTSTLNASKRAFSSYSEKCVWDRLFKFKEIKFMINTHFNFFSI